MILENLPLNYCLIENSFGKYKFIVENDFGKLYNKLMFI